jgi:hypothetical protein
MSNLYIPSKIKVGFQKRSDTFTGKLAYVIYFDEKGKLRKQASWDGWRDSEIEAIEIENKPTSGYIFNKGVRRDGYYWGGGRSSIRIYDPRDFEFEITVDNLMGILMHSDVSKRDIVEECVFAWEGKELVLLPVNSEEYQKSVKYTEKQSGKISAKSLVKGYTYNHKKIEEPLIYIGNFEWFEWGNLQNGQKSRYYYGDHCHYSTGKKHVFYNSETKEFLSPAISAFSSVETEEVVSDYAAIVDAFFSSEHSQPLTNIEILPFSPGKIENQVSNNNEDDEYYDEEDDLNSTYFKVYRKVNDTVECISFGYYPYHYQNGETPLVNFENIDYGLTKFKLTVKNRISTKVDIENDYRKSYYSYHHSGNKNRGELEDELIISAKKLGFDPQNMNLEQAIKVVKEQKFGHLAFVLENGNICPHNTQDYHF